jgi:hypothetical protein
MQGASIFVRESWFSKNTLRRVRYCCDSFDGPETGDYRLIRRVLIKVQASSVSSPISGTKRNERVPRCDRNIEILACHCGA